MGLHQDVAVVSPHDVLLERQIDLAKVCNNDVLSVRLKKVSIEIPIDVSLVRIHDVSCKSQIKHPKMMLYYISTTSRNNIFANFY